MNSGNEGCATRLIEGEDTMIHMLSRFDLQDGIDVEMFANAYARLASAMQAKGMIIGTIALGCRLADTSDGYRCT
jgi:hypothetical protein